MIQAPGLQTCRPAVWFLTRTRLFKPCPSSSLLSLSCSLNTAVNNSFIHSVTQLHSLKLLGLITHRAGETKSQRAQTLWQKHSAHAELTNHIKIIYIHPSLCGPFLPSHSGRDAASTFWAVMLPAEHRCFTVPTVGNPAYSTLPGKQSGSQCGCGEGERRGRINRWRVMLMVLLGMVGGPEQPE